MDFIAIADCANSLLVWLGGSKFIWVTLTSKIHLMPSGKFKELDHEQLNNLSLYQPYEKETSSDMNKNLIVELTTHFWKLFFKDCNDSKSSFENRDCSSAAWNQLIWDFTNLRR